MAKLWLVNGPNMNLLGLREIDTYGTATLQDIEGRCRQLAETAGHELDTKQTNSESVLIDWIQAAQHDRVQAMVFNPAAFTHTSIAIRDALLAVSLPFIEVHLSNPYSRESYRQHSYFSDIALGTIFGFGPIAYELATHAAINHVAHA